MKIFDNPNYDFIKWRTHAVILSLLFIGAGVVMYFVNGVNMGIDFAGGANVVLKFRSASPVSQLRGMLPNATIQQYGPADANSLLIRLPQQGREGDYAGQVVADVHQKLNADGANKHDLNFLGTARLSELLRAADPDVKGTNPAAQTYYDALAKRIIDKRSELGIFTDMGQVSSVTGVTPAVSKVLNERAYLGQFNVLNQETVGPQVGSELQNKALLAVLLSTVAMFLYIWFRFDLAFGAAAMICIIHDVLVVLAFLVMMRLEFSLNVVAAILTIVGYSVNDTVVTYDRIRENRKKIKTPMTMAEHLNLAMNQTLSRTILTAGSVFLVLLAMLIFGGDVIRGFSWIMTIGVISGTYSTLLIVPAVAVAWERWRPSKPTTPAKGRTDTARELPARARRAT